MYTKNKDGYYRSTISTGDGKRITVRAKTLTEFNRKLQEAKNLHDTGYDFSSKDMTVSQWAEKWLETYKKPSISEHQYNNYETNIRLHILPLIGNIPISQIKSYQLQEILNQQENKSKSNTEKIRFALKQIFKKAYENGIIVRDISSGLTMPKVVEGHRRPLTIEEQKIVLNVANNHRAGTWVLLMHYCALRPEEAIALMWSDIDLKDKTLTVKRTVAWSHNQPTLKKPKAKENKQGKEAERTIPLAPELIAHLKSLKHNGLYVCSGDKIFSQTTVRRMWVNFRRECDLLAGAKTQRNKIIIHAFDQSISPYYLRHTCCTRWFELGLDLKTVQYLMGHADIKTTANIYTHFCEKSLDNAKKIISCAKNVPLSN